MTALEVLLAVAWTLAVIFAFWFFIHKPKEDDMDSIPMEGRVYTPNPVKDWSLVRLYGWVWVLVGLATVVTVLWIKGWIF